MLLTQAFQFAKAFFSIPFSPFVFDGLNLFSVWSPSVCIVIIVVPKVDFLSFSSADWHRLNYPSYKYVAIKIIREADYWIDTRRAAHAVFPDMSAKPYRIGIYE